MEFAGSKGDREQNEGSDAMRILVVEDNYFIATALEDILRDADHEVLGPFATAEEALEVISTGEVDGALLDFSLREGDSVAVANELIRHGCPFAFVTGFGGADAIPPSLAQITRIKKPYSIEQILSVVESFRPRGERQVAEGQPAPSTQ